MTDADASHKKRGVAAPSSSYSSSSSSTSSLAADALPPPLPSTLDAAAVGAKSESASASVSSSLLVSTLASSAAQQAADLPAQLAAHDPLVAAQQRLRAATRAHELWQDRESLHVSLAVAKITLLSATSSCSRSRRTSPPPHLHYHHHRPRHLRCPSCVRCLRPSSSGSRHGARHLKRARPSQRPRRNWNSRTAARCAWTGRTLSEACRARHRPAEACPG